jgi:hypothetical protein
MRRIPLFIPEMVNESLYGGLLWYGHKKMDRHENK